MVASIVTSENFMVTPMGGSLLKPAVVLWEGKPSADVSGKCSFRLSAGPFQGINRGSEKGAGYFLSVNICLLSATLVSLNGFIRRLKWNRKC
jgi:hypothetical protein